MCSPAAGCGRGSHDGKALLHILDTYPRDELLQIGEDALYDTAIGVLNLQERQRIALFMRRDPLERFVSCIVYVPRERYDTLLRQTFAAILAEAAFAGSRCRPIYTHLDDQAAGARPIHHPHHAGGAVAASPSGAFPRRISPVAHRRRSMLRRWRRGSPRPGGSGSTASRPLPRRHSARPRRIAG